MKIFRPQSVTTRAIYNLPCRRKKTQTDGNTVCYTLVWVMVKGANPGGGRRITEGEAQHEGTLGRRWWRGEECGKGEDRSVLDKVYDST